MHLVGSASAGSWVRVFACVSGWRTHDYGFACLERVLFAGELTTRGALNKDDTGKGVPKQPRFWGHISSFLAAKDVLQLFLCLVNPAGSMYTLLL